MHRSPLQGSQPPSPCLRDGHPERLRGQHERRRTPLWRHAIAWRAPISATNRRRSRADTTERTGFRCRMDGNGASGARREASGSRRFREAVFKGFDVLLLPVADDALRGAAYHVVRLALGLQRLLCDSLEILGLLREVVWHEVQVCTSSSAGCCDVCAHRTNAQHLRVNRLGGVHSNN